MFMFEKLNQSQNWTWTNSASTPEVPPLHQSQWVTFVGSQAHWVNELYFPRMALKVVAELWCVMSRCAIETECKSCTAAAALLQRGSKDIDNNGVLVAFIKGSRASHIQRKATFWHRAWATCCMHVVSKPFWFGEHSGKETPTVQVSHLLLEWILESYTTCVLDTVGECTCNVRIINLWSTIKMWSKYVIT